MITRDALIWLSRKEGLKDFATRLSFFKKLTTRFVAGDNLDEVVPFIRQLNAENCTASFDHLNESVGSADEAEKEVAEYLDILKRIDEQRIRSNVSIKLTQFGLGLDPELAYRNARRVVEEAHRRGNFVRVDMEDSTVTQVTIDIFKRLRAEFDLNTVGIVLQSYLYRTVKDAEELVKLPGVGRKTANVVLNIAFGQETMAVDTHIFRVANRTGLAPGATVEKVEEKLEQIVPKEFRLHAHHWLILHGRYICKARKPECWHCPVYEVCGYEEKVEFLM